MCFSQPGPGGRVSPVIADQTLFVMAIFVVVVLLVQAFAAPVFGTSARTRRRLRSRIKSLSSTVVDNERVSLVRHHYLQRLSPLGRRLESLAVLAPVVRLLERAGVSMPAYRLVLASVAAGAAALALVPVALPSAGVAAPMAALLAATAPFAWLTRRKGQRLLRFEQGLPDALSMLGRTLRAGLPLSQALQIASQELDGPVSTEFGIVFTELNYGGDLRAALMGMLERIPSVSVVALATAILIQRETGGNLAEVIGRLERLIRDRFRFGRTLTTLTAANRFSAWVVALMPFALGGMMELMSPGYMSALTDNPGGRQLLFAAVGLQVVGILWIRQMVRMDV